MPDIATLSDPAASQRLEQYYEDIDALTGRALSGEIGEDEFRRRLDRLATNALAILFLLGGADLSGPGQNELRREVEQSRNSVAVLADDIFSGRYSVRTEEEAEKGSPPQTADEGREKLRNRLTLWTVTAAGSYAIGQQHSFREVNYRWQYGPTEHCGDCSRLNGVVLSREEWRRLGIRPKDPQLECGGWKCQCEWIPTDEESHGLGGF